MNRCKICGHDHELSEDDICACCYERVASELQNKVKNLEAHNDTLRTQIGKSANPEYSYFSTIEPDDVPAPIGGTVHIINYYIMRMRGDIETTCVSVVEAEVVGYPWGGRISYKTAAEKGETLISNAFPTEEAAVEEIWKRYGKPENRGAYNETNKI